MYKTLYVYQWQLTIKAYPKLLFYFTDVNECQVLDHRCEHSCNNTEGSFACMCNNGYTLAANGKNCSGTWDMNAKNLCSLLSIGTGTNMF